MVSLPLEALQLIQSEVKDVCHVMVRSPTSTRYSILQRQRQCWTKEDWTCKEERKLLHLEWHLPEATWPSSSFAQLKSYSEREIWVVFFPPSKTHFNLGHFQKNKP